MKTKLFLMLVLLVSAMSEIKAQNNGYFGSALIPKNEYLVQNKDSKLFWGISSDKKGVIVTKINQPEDHKIMFIPAGNGYYFIKFLCNGNYLSYTEDDKLYVSPPNRSDLQKFKIIRSGNSEFKFVLAKNKTIECNANNYLIISQANEFKESKFEIIEAVTKKKFTGN